MQEPFIGEIALFAFDFAPLGWFPCDGKTLPIAQYQALFALIGNRFGGNGSSTFALPNLKGKEPDPGLHYCIAWQGIWPDRP